MLNNTLDYTQEQEMPSDHDRILLLEKDNIRLRAEYINFKTEVHAIIDKKIMLLVGLTAVNVISTFGGQFLQ